MPDFSLDHCSTIYELGYSFLFDMRAGKPTNALPADKIICSSLTLTCGALSGPWAVHHGHRTRLGDDAGPGNCLGGPRLNEKQVRTTRSPPGELYVAGRSPCPWNKRIGSTPFWVKRRFVYLSIEYLRTTIVGVGALSSSLEGFGCAVSGGVA